MANHETKPGKIEPTVEVDEITGPSSSDEELGRMDPEIAKIMKPYLEALKKEQSKINIPNPLTFRQPMTF